MKWVKHKVDSHDDPDIFSAMTKFGDAGYSVYFIIMEVYGAEFHHVVDEYIPYDIPLLCQKLRKRWTTVELILNYYQTKDRISYKTNGDEIFIKVHNFKEFMDNWSTRNKPQHSVVTTEQLPSQEEDKNKNKEEDESLRKDSIPEPQEEAAGKEAGFLTIPLVDKTEFEVTLSYIEEMQVLFPAINVRQVIRNIKAWNINNPVNRKTRRGIKRHINGWLEKEQNKAKKENSKPRNNYGEIDKPDTSSVREDQEYQKLYDELYPEEAEARRKERG